MLAQQDGKEIVMVSLHISGLCTTVPQFGFRALVHFIVQVFECVSLFRYFRGIVRTCLGCYRAPVSRSEPENLKDTHWL